MDAVICGIPDIPRRGVDAAVVIDVLRAFTVAPWVLHRGAASLTLAATDADALALKNQLGSSAVAVTDGAPKPGFDLANSPAVASRVDNVRQRRSS